MLETILSVIFITGLLNLMYFDMKTSVYHSPEFIDYTNVFLYGSFGLPYILSLFVLNMFLITLFVCKELIQGVYQSLQLTYHVFAGDFEQITNFLEDKLNINLEKDMLTYIMVGNR